MPPQRVAHPCPVPHWLPAPPHKDTTVNHIDLDAADAVEVIEILEYFIETIDCASAHGLVSRLYENCGSYDIDDLRADLTRLVDRLNHSRLTP